MDLYYDMIYDGEESYIISYKDYLGKEDVVIGKALNKLDAQREFNIIFPACEVLNVQTSKEWIHQTSKECVENIMKNVDVDNIATLFDWN